MFPSFEALFILVDLFHPELLLLIQQVVAVVPLVQGDQNILEPVSHTKGELGQLSIHARSDQFARPNVIQVQLVSLFRTLQGAFGGKEVASRLIGLVVSATDLFKLTNTDWTAGGVLANTHGGVVLIYLTNLSMLAVMAQAWIFRDNVLLSIINCFIKLPNFHLHRVDSHRLLGYSLLYHFNLFWQSILLRSS